MVLGHQSFVPCPFSGPEQSTAQSETHSITQSQNRSITQSPNPHWHNSPEWVRSFKKWLRSLKQGADGPNNAQKMGSFQAVSLMPKDLLASFLIFEPLYFLAPFVGNPLFAQGLNVLEGPNKCLWIFRLFFRDPSTSFYSVP
jgi:hypothetical protein